MKKIEKAIAKFSKDNNIVPKEENLEKCLSLLKQTEMKNRDIQRFLRILFHHEFDNIETAWQQQQSIRFGNSLETLKIFFGEEEGLRRFEQNKKASSKRNKVS